MDICFNVYTAHCISHLVHCAGDALMKTWMKIFYWLLGLFTVYLIIEVIRKILSGSLGFEDVVIGLLVANLGYSFYISSKLSEHIGWHRGRDNL